MIIETLAAQFRMHFGLAVSSAEVNKSWIEDNIGKVSLTSSGTQCKATVQGAYLFKNAEGPFRERLQDIFARTIPSYSRRYQCTLQPIAATGSNERQSIDNLMTTIFSYFIAGSRIPVRVLKPGQDACEIFPDYKYLTVHHEDSLHDHNDPRLIDFNLLVLNPSQKSVETLPFDRYHCHIIDPKLMR